MNLGAGLVRQGYAVLAIDFDPQANLTMALGFKSPDDMEYTVSNILAKAMDEEPIDPAEGILTTEEGVDLMPSSIQLSRYELSLVNDGLLAYCFFKSYLYSSFPFNSLSLSLLMLGSKNKHFPNHLDKMLEKLRNLM